jgi:hypothetical protein
MIQNPLAKIFSVSHVAKSPRSVALNEINVVHGRRDSARAGAQPSCGFTNSWGVRSSADGRAICSPTDGVSRALLRQGFGGHLSPSLRDGERWRRGRDWLAFGQGLRPRRYASPHLRSLCSLRRTAGVLHPSSRELQNKWRRGRDSNPRYLAAHALSKRAHSTTLPPLR